MARKPHRSFIVDPVERARGSAFIQDLQQEFDGSKTTLTVSRANENLLFEIPISMTELREHRDFVMSTLWEASLAVIAKRDQYIWALTRHGVPVAELASLFTGREEGEGRRVTITSTELERRPGKIVRDAREGIEQLLTNRGCPIGIIRPAQTPPSERAAAGEAPK